MIGGGKFLSVPYKSSLNCCKLFVSSLFFKITEFLALLIFLNLLECNVCGELLVTKLLVGDRMFVWLL